MKKQLRLFSAALCSFVTLGFSSMDANAQTYCQPSSWLDNSEEWITNVTFAGINNSTGAGATAYSNFSTTVTPGQVTIGTAYTLSVTIAPDANEYVYAFIDWNHNGILDNAGEKYLLASNVSSTGPHTLSITPPATALTGNTRMRIMLDWLDWNYGDPCLEETEYLEFGFGEVEDYTINVQSSSPVVTSVAVATQGGAPATITTNAGTLQMAATVLPATAPQTVTWSIVPGTGTATISAAGLVTAQTNGTVWAKAVSTADVSKKDSLQITLSNQVVPVTSVAVVTQGGAPATITTNAGTLQMAATVLPAAAPQTVTWSIVPGTGTATISAAGLVTAQTNGTVWAKAVSTADVSKKRFFANHLEQPGRSGYQCNGSYTRWSTCRDHNDCRHFANDGNRIASQCNTNGYLEYCSGNRNRNDFCCWFSYGTNKRNSLGKSGFDCRCQ